jgi:cytoskeletal protein RodZ
MRGTASSEGRNADRRRELVERESGRRDEAVPRGSFGAWLKTHREARNVSLSDIAESSKISTRFLQALESDRFDALPAEVFVRGFLREYARIVGLDRDEVVNLYLVASEAQREAVVPAVAPATTRRDSSVIGYGLLVAAVLVLLLGSAAAISFWVGRDHAKAPGEPGDGSPPSPAAGESTPGAAAAPLLPAPLVTLDPEPAPRQAQGEQEPLRVVLEFQQDCWVELVVDGRRRASELKAGGETWAIEAFDSVLLTLGNAPAVRVVVDGRTIELPMLGSPVVREFRIDRDAVESGVAGSDLSGT